MSTATLTPEINTAQSVPPQSKRRFRWVDQVRGGVLLYVLICKLLPWQGGTALTAFLFLHAPYNASFMTLRDFNTSAFIFLMGFLYGFAYLRHVKRSGVASARKQLFSRYLMILGVGVLISFIASGRFVYEFEPTSGGRMLIVVWDVLQTIGLVGLVGFPFLFLGVKQRIVAGYGLLLFYQIMLMILDTGWVVYALESAHGGILTAAFAYSGQLIIASALGEFFFAHAATSARKVYTRLVVFAVANLGLGFALASLPVMETSKRTGSLTYCLICMGLTMTVALFFVVLEKWNKTIKLFDAIGKNSLLVYLIAAILQLIFYTIALMDEHLLIQWGAGVVGFVCVIAFASELHERNVMVRTEKVAFATLVGLMVAVGVMIPMGILPK